MKRSFWVRGFGAACMAISVIAGGVSPAHGQIWHLDPPGPGRRELFVGTVMNLHGPATAPDFLTVQLGTTSLDVHTDAKTTFTAQSAEAQVEGLVNGDYAKVFIRRVKQDWVANRILFDVLPVPPLQEWQGTIVRMNADGDHFQFRGRNVETNAERTIFMRVSVTARFLVQGKPVDGAIPLAKGNLIQILCVARGGWTVFEIDVKSAGASPHAGMR